MNKILLIPALIVGLSLSSAAMAKSKGGVTKRTRLAKAEKHVRKAKNKAQMEKSELR